MRRANVNEGFFLRLGMSRSMSLDKQSNPWPKGILASGVLFDPATVGKMYIL